MTVAGNLNEDVQAFFELTCRMKDGAWCISLAYHQWDCPVTFKPEGIFGNIAH